MKALSRFIGMGLFLIADYTDFTLIFYDFEAVLKGFCNFLTLITLILTTNYTNFADFDNF